MPTNGLGDMSISVWQLYVQCPPAMVPRAITCSTVLMMQHAVGER